MDRDIVRNYIEILKYELVPALGCTEPIAIAYAAAKAREVLGEMPTSMELCCSGNIIKNVKAVTVPNSGGLKGIEVAGVLGVLGGDANRELEVLESVTKEQIEVAKKLIEEVENLYISATVVSKEHSAEVTIVNRHTLITKIVKDGQILLENSIHEEANERFDKSKLNVKDILEFADTVSIEEIKPILERQVEMKTAKKKRDKKSVRSTGGKNTVSHLWKRCLYKSKSSSSGGIRCKNERLFLASCYQLRKWKSRNDSISSCYRICKGITSWGRKNVSCFGS